MKTLKLKSSKQNILKTTADVAAMRVFLLLALMLLCCSGMFGQQSEAGQIAIPVGNTTVADGVRSEKVEASDSNRQLKLVQWFMGSKQINPATQSAKTSTKQETPKRVLINCGMTPNRILSRTLLKKAMQYENNIA